MAVNNSKLRQDTCPTLAKHSHGKGNANRKNFSGEMFSAAGAERGTGSGKYRQLLARSAEVLLMLRKPSKTVTKQVPVLARSARSMREKKACTDARMATTMVATT